MHSLPRRFRIPFLTGNFEFICLKTSVTYDIILTHIVKGGDYVGSRKGNEKESN